MNKQKISFIAWIMISALSWVLLIFSIVHIVNDRQTLESLQRIEQQTQYETIYETLNTIKQNQMLAAQMEPITITIPTDSIRPTEQSKQ